MGKAAWHRPAGFAPPARTGERWLGHGMRFLQDIRLKQSKGRDTISGRLRCAPVREKERPVKTVSALVAIALVLTLAGCANPRGVRCSIFTTGFPLCGI